MNQQKNARLYPTFRRFHLRDYYLNASIIRQIHFFIIQKSNCLRSLYFLYHNLFFPRQNICYFKISTLSLFSYHLRCQVFLFALYNYYVVNKTSNFLYTQTLNSNYFFITLITMSDFSINLLMSQQQKLKNEVQNTDQTYLDTVIDCITDRNTKRIPIEDANIGNLYSRANSMIKEFDSGISLCKKYNEAKINRKYQIIIHDLQAQIKRLQDSLKLQQDARSPTKKHVSDILQKLVQLRAQNQELKQENLELKDNVKSLNDTLDIQTIALNKLQGIQTKGTIERLPPIGNGLTVGQGVKQYLKDKEQVRKITKIQVSGLQRLLNQLKPKLWNISVGNLLEQIDKWGQGVKEKPTAEIDMWRIRSSIARKFSDYMDNPQNLTRPSAKFKSQQTLWEKLQQKNHLQTSKFSYLGSKRSLDASFH